VFYLDLFGALSEAKVHYVIVGGLALNLHGVERATMDVDLAVALDAPNWQTAIDVFKGLRLEPIVPVTLDQASDPARLREWKRDRHMLVFGLRSAIVQGPTVDVLIDPPVDFAELAVRAVVKRVGTLSIPVASIDDLIVLKRAAGRQIDRADIEALESLQRLGLDRG
jgi:Nucleotidyl transferase AbiEii toxin, Type IV TA system